MAAWRVLACGCILDLSKMYSWCYSLYGAYSGALYRFDTSLLDSARFQIATSSMEPLCHNARTGVLTLPKSATPIKTSFPLLLNCDDGMLDVEIKSRTPSM